MLNSSIVLLNSDPSLINKTNCYVLGWGTINDTVKVSPEVLQELSLPIIEHHYCIIKFGYKNYDSKTMFCAGHIEGGRSSCMGDSGGPFVCESKSEPNLYVLQGLVSFGTKSCAKPGYPAVFTNIPVFIGWISQKTKIFIYQKSIKNCKANDKSRLIFISFIEETSPIAEEASNLFLFICLITIIIIILVAAIVKVLKDNSKIFNKILESLIKKPMKSTVKTIEKFKYNSEFVSESSS